MTYKDLSNFTYKELRFFTYADISLDKYELEIHNFTGVYRTS